MLLLVPTQRVGRVGTALYTVYTEIQRHKYKFTKTQIQIRGYNYAPPRSNTAGRVGTALHWDDTVNRYKYIDTKTQIQIHNHANTNLRENYAPCHSDLAGLAALGYIALHWNIFHQLRYPTQHCSFCLGEA